MLLFHFYNKRRFLVLFPIHFSQQGQQAAQRFRTGDDPVMIMLQQLFQGRPQGRRQGRHGAPVGGDEVDLGALIALQNADRSLSRSDKPQFITIRRAIGRDMEKLKALPSVDSTGVALRLDAVIAQIDALPMLSDETPALPAAPEKAGKPVRNAAGKLVGPPAPEPLLQQVRNGWDTWSGDMWNDVRQLIRIRRVDTPEALMLSPTQSYFLRENIKLRLLNARMALLSRNETAFRNDLIAAQDGLAKYFDTRARATQTAQGLLRQVQASNLTIEMPTLSDSLTAVRNYKAKS